MLLVISSVLLILLPELSYYIGFTNAAFASGMVKTYIYFVALLFGLLVYTQKHQPLEPVINIFIVFTLFTIISTSLGITPDISIWRQCIHLTFFGSALVTFYLGTERMGIKSCSKYLILAYAVVAIVYCFAVVLGSGGIVGNAIYFLLLFLPVTSFISSSLLRKVMYFLQTFMVLISNKRTALIALIVYFFVHEWLSNKNISGYKKILKGFAYIAVVLAIYFLYPIITQNFDITVFDELSSSHIMEDGGSNRFYIYERLWSVQRSSNMSHWLIGSGYNSVLLSHICTDGVGGEWVSAHNDFLEVLYDYGIIGLGLYIAFFSLMIRKAYGMLKKKYCYAVPFFCSIAMTIIISLTSHLVIYLNYYSIMFVFWGICLADYRNYLSQQEGCAK